MSKRAKDKAPKGPILRWRGTFADADRSTRVINILSLMVAAVALTYTQLGFVNISFLDERGGAYMVLLLPLVALGSMLFGPIEGAGIGLFSGAVLLIHARLMPLNYYELTFVTPVTAVVELTIAGFLLGILFALALRREVPRWRRVLRVFLICTLVSWLYSIGFVTNAVSSLFAMIAQLPEDALMQDGEIPNNVRLMVLSGFMRLGQVGTQARVDALAMTIFALVGYVASKNWVRISKNMDLRTMFRAWLGGGAITIFMVVATVGFVGITIAERAAEETEMRNEAEYLFTQVDAAFNRTRDLFDVLEPVGLPVDFWNQEKVQGMLDSISPSGVLNGYNMESDGLIVASADGMVLFSDHEKLTEGVMLADYLNDEVIQGVNECLATGKVQRVVFDGVLEVPESIEDIAATIGQSELAYVYAEEHDGITIMVLHPTRMAFVERGNAMVSTTAAAAAVLLAAFGLTSYLIRRAVTKDIDVTNDVLGRITGGDLDARVPRTSTSDFNELSDGINHTVDALQGWIAEAETRMDAELAAARTIQESALPRTFPPYPDIPRFDIYATMEAAREVGGDFYDFFLLGDDCGPESGKLAFVVADVSGKGVPASLFMMKAKAQIRDFLSSGLELGEALENANAQLCDGNDAGMFVTAWIGVLDYGTGRVEYVNAGHNPPLLWHADGEWEWVKQRGGVPLGLFDESPYKAHELECKDGDKLLLYTDGVTEAMDVDEALYGEDRLMALVQGEADLPARELVEAVYGDVKSYATGAEQSDDITILALGVGVPPEVTAELAVPARLGEMERVVDFVDEELEKRLCPVRVRHQVAIAVEELFVNVAHYAYPEATEDNPGNVLIRRTYSTNPNTISIDIIDSGIPFDPTAKADPAKPTSVEDVPIGGLGIFMVKKTMDEMLYVRESGTNVVTIIKHW